MKKRFYLFIPLILMIILLSSSNTKTFTIDRNNYQGQRIVRASEYLMVRSNVDSITSYENGNKYDMYTFKNDDIVEYRYIGKEPSNYVYFNCSDVTDVSTCELWRIIGVFKVENSHGENQFRLKIMRSEPIIDVSWNSNNNWNDSKIKKYLNNGEYWYSLKGKAQNMIDVAKFYIGGINNHNVNITDIYNQEHSNNSYNNYPYDFYGKIGLLSLSDYGYTFAYNVNNSCFNNVYSCNDYSDSWMKFENPTWTMISSSNSNNVYIVGDNTTLHNPDEKHDIYPVAYLKYDIVIEGGNGTLNDAYILRALTKSDIQKEQDMIKDGDKSDVNVDDTGLSISQFIIIFSIVVISFGIVFFAITYIRSRNELKR